MKPFMKKMGFFATLLIVTLSVAYAQGGPPFRKGPPQERIEQLKKIRLMEVLRLDEQGAIKFFTRYNKHADSFRENRMKRNAMLDQVGILIKTNASEKEYEKIIREVRALDTQLTENWLQYIDGLSEVLSTKQIAEYITFERNFNQDLRDFVRDIQRERREELMR